MRKSIFIANSSIEKPFNIFPNQSCSIRDVCQGPEYAPEIIQGHI